jgi:hypothetical protein
MRADRFVRNIAAQQRFDLPLQHSPARLDSVGLCRLAVTIANQENFDVQRRRRAPLDWIVILGIFAPCLLFWALIVTALMRFL